ncbi:hypothetical protein ACFSL6_04885 [Paenibacillus thailandensis]|uniref:50S ribosomal protein L33 n=1 Tax=Paenibacillus thailandensis TaxID=393250 RepID=A0ABW5QXC9_9BACL
MQHVTREQALRLVGKDIYAVRRDNSVATGRLVGLRGDKLVLEPLRKDRGKTVHTRGFILPLLLFDLLAIGTLPFWGFGGCGCGGGCGGYGGYGGYGKPKPGYYKNGYNGYKNYGGYGGGYYY